MPTKVNNQAILLSLPVGTQVVTRVDYKNSSGEITCLAGPEKSVMEKTDLSFHQAVFERLTKALEQAMLDSQLPESFSGKAQLHDLLVRTRLSQQ
jgi:hypothetical protein